MSSGKICPPCAGSLSFLYFLLFENVDLQLKVSFVTHLYCKKNLDENPIVQEPGFTGWRELDPRAFIEYDTICNLHGKLREG